jgi:hypothetical protein
MSPGLSRKAGACAGLIVTVRWLDRDTLDSIWFFDLRDAEFAWGPAS